VITQGQFGSVLLDRFVAELNKLGVKWDRKDIAFGELVNGAPVENRPVERSVERLAAGTVQLVSSKTADFSIGIDIQQVAELPDCIDYWEDEFYKMKFTREEIAYAVGRNNPKETFAGIYSCKEALIKCNNALEWSSIGITYGADGGPQFADYHLSISHSGGQAIAIAVQHKAGNRPGLNGDPYAGADARETLFKVSPPVEKRGSSKATALLFVLMTVVIFYLIYRDFIR
jgi:phosphopantetheinyl transferase (holo-ACP synthase)